MARCRDCGAEIAWEQRNGKLVPVDLERPIHYRSPAHVAARRRKREENPDYEQAAEALAGLGYKKGDAKRWLAGARGTSEELVRYALARREREMAP